jgi:putative pyruvate formate lyase activating enzyme
MYESGELQRRVERLEAMLAPCTLCPRNCRNNRLNDEIAACYSGRLPIVSSHCLHFGEEPALGGTHGVGNIFFGNCNLRCVYCQNHLISQNWRVERQNEIPVERLAGIMLELQELGVHSIGFVSPTHFVPQIIRAVMIAIPKGLTLPLIYNTNAYDSVEVLRVLDGIIDIYLPDLKYAGNDDAYRYSKIHDYVPYARSAITEMHRQVGTELVVDDEGVIRRGLIIRHLVLPNDLACSEDTLEWISSALDPQVTLSIMAQYYPAHKAQTMELLNRRIRESEYTRVLQYLDRYHLANGWIQDFDSHEYYRPDFTDRVRPFKERESNISEGEHCYDIDVADGRQRRVEKPQGMETRRQGDPERV